MSISDKDFSTHCSPEFFEAVAGRLEELDLPPSIAGWRPSEVGRYTEAVSLTLALWRFSEPDHLTDYIVNEAALCLGEFWTSVHEYFSARHGSNPVLYVISLDAIVFYSLKKLNERLDPLKLNPLELKETTDKGGPETPPKTVEPHSEAPPETEPLDNPEAFIKHSKDKLRYELIPPEATKALARVLSHGAKKYSPHNWKKCPDTDEYVGALMRHLEAFRAGEAIDPDSGLPATDHILANAAFLSYFTEYTENE